MCNFFLVQFAMMSYNCLFNLLKSTNLNMSLEYKISKLQRVTSDLKKW